MKKSLITLAVAGTLAGSALAQSSVTLYGLVDLSINSVKHTDRTDGVETLAGNDTSGAKMESGNVLGSRWGIKGTEDIGNGLSAGFTLEQGFNADNGNDTHSTSARQFSFSRRATVSLSGGFGSVNLGRQWALSDDVGYGVDYTSTYPDRLTDARLDNTIRYDGSFGPVGVSAMYGLGEVAGNNAQNNYSGIMLSYADGPLSLAIVADQISKNQVNDSIDLGAFKEIRVANNNGRFTHFSGVRPKVITTAFAGQYDFGIVNLKLSYARNKSDNTTAAESLNATSDGVTSRITSVGNVGNLTSISLVGEIPIGSMSLAVGYRRTRLDEDIPFTFINAAGNSSAGSISDVKETAYGLRFTYPLSSRTSTYFGYDSKRKVWNDNLIAANIVNEGVITDSKFGIGMIHKF